MKEWQKSSENLREHYSTTAEETGKDEEMKEWQKSWGNRREHYSRGNRKR
jgi:hypothetical protein